VSGRAVVVGSVGELTFLSVFMPASCSNITAVNRLSSTPAKYLCLIASLKHQQTQDHADIGQWLENMWEIFLPANGTTTTLKTYSVSLQTSSKLN